MQLSIRSMIVAPPNKLLLAVDLSQAESWVVAYLANEPNMKWALHNSDIHTQTAGSALFYSNTGCPHVWIKDTSSCKLCNRVIEKTARYIGKRYNHASSYRMGYLRAAQVINKDSDKPPYVTVTNSESKRYHESWHNYYHLNGWWEEIERQLSIDRTLTTPYGRRRMFFGAWGDELFKAATAHVPQSTVSDHFRGAVHPELGIHGGTLEVLRQIVRGHEQEVKIVNDSHDSILMEVPSSSVQEIKEHVISLVKRPLVINGEEFTIPVDAEIGERYGELRKAT